MLSTGQQWYKKLLQKLFVPMFSWIGTKSFFRSFLYHFSPVLSYHLCLKTKHVNYFFSCLERFYCTYSNKDSIPFYWSFRSFYRYCYAWLSCIGILTSVQYVRVFPVEFAFPQHWKWTVYRWLWRKWHTWFAELLKSTWCICVPALHAWISWAFIFYFSNTS